MDGNIGSLSISFKANDEQVQKAINGIVKTISGMQKKINSSMNQPLKNASKNAQSFTTNMNKAFSSMTTTSTKSANSVNTNLKAISNQAKRTAKEVKNIGTSGSAGFGNLLQKMTSLAKFGGFAYLTRQVMGFGSRIIELGSDMAETENLFQVSFKNMSSEADAFAERLQQAWGVDTTSVKEQTAYLNQMLTSMHFGSQTAYTMSTELEKLSYNMSSLYNIDQSTAYEKLRSGIAGKNLPYIVVTLYRILFNLWEV